MMIGMGIFWLVVIVGLVWVVRNGTEHRRQRAEETALTLLDRRFAEGAISLDEYHERKNILASQGRSG